jgi:hypothetical protein
MADIDEIVKGLRAWAAGDRINEAAVELLIAHGTWLRRGDFLRAAIDQGDGMARVDWDAAREFERDSPASTTERAMLRLAVAIGSDEFRLAAMGPANAQAITRALAAATRMDGMLRG